MFLIVYVERNRYCTTEKYLKKKVFIDTMDETEKQRLSDLEELENETL